MHSSMERSLEGFIRFLIVLLICVFILIILVSFILGIICSEEIGTINGIKSIEIYKDGYMCLMDDNTKIVADNKKVSKNTEVPYVSVKRYLNSSCEDYTYKVTAYVNKNTETLNKEDSRLEDTYENVESLKVSLLYSIDAYNIEDADIVKLLRQLNEDSDKNREGNEKKAKEDAEAILKNIDDILNNGETEKKDGVIGF